MAKGRLIHIQIDVTVPAATGEADVANAVNQALNEAYPESCDWGDWEVSAAYVTGTEAIEIPDAEESECA